MGKMQIIVLAAGQGKRMRSKLPKVLVPLYRKPLIMHLLESIKISGVCAKPIIVVGRQRKLVMQTLGDEYEYVIQKKQLGTGHAVLSTSKLLEGKVKNIMVINGDMPFIAPSTIKKIINFHLAHGKNMTMTTTHIKNFDGVRKAFFSFGRISRDKKGQILKIIYGKKLTKKELSITEVDPSYFCFRTDWLWEKLQLIKNKNIKKEYSLVDIVEIAVKKGNPPKIIEIPEGEAFGVNSKEDLDILEGLKLNLQ